MTLEQFAYLAEIVGVIVIVVTLIYLCSGQVIPDTLLRVFFVIHRC